MIEAPVGKEKRSDFHHLSFIGKICIDFRHNQGLTDRFSFRNEFYLQWNGLGNLNSYQLQNMRSISRFYENGQERPNDTFKNENVLLSVHKPP